MAGSHAYAAAGEYAVTALVTDVTSGQTITTTSWVDATPAAVLGYGGALAAAVGQATSGTTPLAVFTGSASLAASAVVDWGDGTAPVGAAVQQLGYGLAEVLGSHTYATAGVYAVKTLVYDATGALIGAAVPMVEAAGPAAVTGPAVVPGNSYYTYIFGVPPIDSDKIAKWTFRDSTVGGAYTATQISNQAGKPVRFNLEQGFANQPAQGDLRLEYWLTGEKDPKEVNFPVTVVQVKVENPPGGAFSTPFPKPVDDAQNVTAVPGATIDNKAGPNEMKLLATDNEDEKNFKPAFMFNAQVTLIGPGDGTKGVADIRVGFVQLATLPRGT